MSVLVTTGALGLEAEDRGRGDSMFGERLFLLTFEPLVVMLIFTPFLLCFPMDGVDSAGEGASLSSTSVGWAAS